MARRLKGQAAIDLSRLPEGERSDLQVPIYENALGVPLLLPVIVLRGSKPGKTVGICAAVHGDELNGIRIIHEICSTLDPKDLSGSLVCVPVVNIPAFLSRQRKFPEDDKDINHVFPGSKSGAESSQYARAFLDTFLPAIDYMIDIHTASEGRVNTLYVRVDYGNEVARRMAELIGPKIILHGKSGDGTLRSAARRNGIPSITVEAGNPSVFQGRMVMEGETGIRRILDHLGLIDFREGAADEVPEPVVCASSRWLRTRRGGIMRLPFSLGQMVEKGEVLAEIRDIFGNLVDSYRAPQDGIVIGMAQSPLSVPGVRYCHLGIIGTPSGDEP